MMRPMDPLAPLDTRLAAIRELLPATSAGIRLDATIAGPLPAETDRAMRELDAWRLRVGRSDPGRDDDRIQRAAEARAVIAAVLGADPDRMVLAPGIRAIAGALAAMTTRAGDALTVVGAVSGDLRAACTAVARAHGLRLCAIDPDDPLDPGTRVVVMPDLDALRGDPVPRPAVVARARELDALVVLDASWSVGALALQVGTLDADVVLVAADHWLMGPDGVAAAWLGERLDPRTIDGLVDDPPVTTLLGVARSVGWLLMYVGLPWAIERTAAAALRLRAGLAAVPGVSLLGDRDSTSHVLGVRLDAWPATAAAAELGGRCFAVVDVDDEHDLLRISTGPWLRDEEIDRFVAELVEVAAHTPDTLPRRPVLAVLGQ